MKKSVSLWALRVSTACAGIGLAIGAVATPATAESPRPAATPQTRAATPPAPAPTGLAYSYDVASQTVTVTWAPKDADDSLTLGYHPGFCGPTTLEPCFVSNQVINGNTFSFHRAPGSTAYFKIYAENADHRFTGSAVLVITT
ncbi:hypothetical protein [Streptomyces sp. NPDC019224]|uniref:hypothetical protein n=1 Tax=Streptomyces sp. NPDC019224 TaxID=3154484 RepID=UPI0033E93236